MPNLPGIYYQPPPVFTGGKQPYSQRKMAVALLDVVPSSRGGQLWAAFPDKDPGLYTRYQRTRKVSPAILDLRPDNPPFSYAGRNLDTIATIWQSQPPPPSPQMGKGPMRRTQLLPTALNLVPDNPRFGHPMRHRRMQQQVVGLSTAPTWGPQRVEPIAAELYEAPPPPVSAPSDMIRNPMRANAGLRNVMRSQFVPTRNPQPGVGQHA